MKTNNLQTTKTRLLLLAVFHFISVVGGPLHAQQNFPAFPPSNVTAAMDRDQMLFQLGIILPALPSKLNDPNAPKNAVPADSTKPEGNWKDAYGHIITRSGWGLWNNYDDRTDGFFPGKDSVHVGKYSPIDLLKNKNGKIITTAQEWWQIRRLEILRDAQQLLYGVPPPDSVLPGFSFNVTTFHGGKGEGAYIQKEITGFIDIFRYTQVRDAPYISAVLRIPVPANITGWQELFPVGRSVGGGSVSSAKDRALSRGCS